eukprot:665171-Amphidinium_carterae.1
MCAHCRSNGAVQVRVADMIFASHCSPRIGELHMAPRTKAKLPDGASPHVKPSRPEPCLTHVQRTSYFHVDLQTLGVPVCSRWAFNGVEDRKSRIGDARHKIFDSASCTLNSPDLTLSLCVLHSNVELCPCNKAIVKCKISAHHQVRQH